MPTLPDPPPTEIPTRQPIAATFTVLSDTHVSVVVPAGATGGPIEATRPQGTAFSARSSAS